MRRTTFKLLGTGCVGLGIIGAFLPIFPSTIFFILAAACFARSSPRLEARILRHPVFGPPVVAWREYGAITKKAKILAVSGMAFGYGMFHFTARPEPWLALLVGGFILACAWYVVSRPSGPAGGNHADAAVPKTPGDDATRQKSGRTVSEDPPAAWENAPSDQEPAMDLKDRE